MYSGGKTTLSDVALGRKEICREKPTTAATSKCAKQLAKTVAASKKGLTAAQLKLWRHFVYTPALINVAQFCDDKASPTVCDPWDVGCAKRNGQRLMNYDVCALKVLSDKLKFTTLLGTKFKWTKFLSWGGLLITGMLKPGAIKFGGNPAKTGNPAPRPKPTPRKRPIFKRGNPFKTGAQVIK